MEFNDKIILSAVSLILIIGFAILHIFAPPTNHFNFMTSTGPLIYNDTNITVNMGDNVSDLYFTPPNNWAVGVNVINQTLSNPALIVAVKNNQNTSVFMNTLNNIQDFYMSCETNMSSNIGSVNITTGSNYIGTMVLSPSIDQYCYQEFANTTVCYETQNGSYSMGVAAPCYQKDAETASICGGLSTGGYYSVRDNAAANRPNYIYISYTKPSGATSAKWQFAHGNYTPYNSTIPDSCFNQVTIQIQVVSSGNNTATASYATCWNGTNWYDFDAHPIKWPFCSCHGSAFDCVYSCAYSGTSNTSITRFLDENWTTGVAFASAAIPNIWQSDYSSETETGTYYTNIYDEGMWWTITGPSLETCQQTFANDTSCNNPSIGGYSFSSYFNDGNWSTFDAFVNDTYYYTNFSIPRSYNTSVLTVGVRNDVSSYNVTMTPHIGCINNTDGMLQTRVKSTYLSILPGWEFSCWNGTAYKYMSNYYTGSANPGLVEQYMSWVIDPAYVSNFTDGNWSTYSTSWVNIMYMNKSLLTNSSTPLINALWTYKYRAPRWDNGDNVCPTTGGTDTTVNVSIPAVCYNANNFTITYNVTNITGSLRNASYFCNGNLFYSYTYSISGFGFQLCPAMFYEESASWNAGSIGSMENNSGIWCYGNFNNPAPSGSFNWTIWSG